MGEERAGLGSLRQRTCARVGWGWGWWGFGCSRSIPTRLLPSCTHICLIAVRSLALVTRLYISILPLLYYLTPAFTRDTQGSMNIEVKASGVPRLEHPGINHVGRSSRPRLVGSFLHREMITVRCAGRGEEVGMEGGRWNGGGRYPHPLPPSLPPSIPAYSSPSLRPISTLSFQHSAHLGRYGMQNHIL